MRFEDILGVSPFSLEKKEKEKLLTDRLTELTSRHFKQCEEYGKILHSINFDFDKVKSYKDLPFLPVRLFKELDLKSVSDQDVVKVLTSSGTSGQRVSKMYLDKATSTNQQKALVKIVNSFTGSGRMPMIIIDCPSVVKDRKMFSARGAGILGFSIFGSKTVYALNDDMQLNVEGIREFLDKYKGERIFLFGFTFIIWQYFYKELVRLKQQGISFDLSNGILIHGGGWKKLISEAVSPKEFHDRLNEVCNLNSIHDYYGMVEQTGCIYMQCECGHLHASIFSDVIVRRPIDFSECENGEKGIIQVVSTIPESYPGHSILTEDEGIILGEDDCPCGRKGKYFKIVGRIKDAEIRGCSDTFAADHSNNREAIPGEEDALNKVKFLVGNSETVIKMPEVTPLKPFCDEVISFCDDFSKHLMKSKEAKAYPDVVTLGFWLRKASVQKMKERFCTEIIRIGRGVAFHIAPSNVPVNYAYSLFTGLLCGNANIVRIPSKNFPQVGIINAAIDEVLEHHNMFKDYISLVQYDRSKDINDYFSSLCDIRMIWGGDDTIAEIRRSSIKARTTEVTFADRYSLAVIGADYYMSLVNSGDENELLRIARDFYNDTYLSDQNACTSPRVVVWIGTNKAEAQDIFWAKEYEVVKEKYNFQPIQGIDKLTNQFLATTMYDEELSPVGQYDNRLVRAKVSKLTPELMRFRGNSGFFYEYECKDILSIREFCNDTHCQTIGVLGEKETLYRLIESGLRGVDRVVQIGHTMDFDLIWDGYDLPTALTRTVGNM